MLQQTQVERVIPKYKNFLKKFPTARSLAAASSASVVREWQGLGYNRRALYVQRSASALSRCFPRSVTTLEALQGVGPYTARAVSVFAWNTKEVFLETNIRRVFIHFYFPTRVRVSDKAILALVEKTLYAKNLRMWYWALMDYGAGALKALPNPNRKSAHYTRQSRFEGSRRYARAKTLQYIAESREGVAEKMLSIFFKKDSRLQGYAPDDILSRLMADGFIVKKGRRWYLSE